MLQQQPQILFLQDLMEVLVLVDALNPTRSMTHHPLVQVALAWQNMNGIDPTALDTELCLGDLDVTRLPIDTRTARMDLVFSLAEHFTDDGVAAGIGGTVEFRTDVFDVATIDTLIARLARVLAAMTADPEQRVGSVDVPQEAFLAVLSTDDDD